MLQKIVTNFSKNLPHQQNMSSSVRHILSHRLETTIAPHFGEYLSRVEPLRLQTMPSLAKYSLTNCIYVTNIKRWYQLRDALFTRQIFISTQCSYVRVDVTIFAIFHTISLQFNATHFISSSNSVKVCILHRQSALRHDVSMMRYLSWFGK